MARLTSCMILLIAFCSSVVMTSCDYFPTGTSDIGNSIGTIPTSDTTQTTQASQTTETSDSQTDASTTETTTAETTKSNAVTIISSKNDITSATAMGLRSAVSIYCTFESAYGGTSPWNPKPSTQTYYTTGSGVIYQIDESGSAFIITNHHVVYASESETDNHISDEIYVYLYGLENEAYAISATYVGGSANYDLAILRIDENEILKEAYLTGSAAAVRFADSDEIIPGQTTIAIGNPSAEELGGISVTSGIVSVDSEYITMEANDGSGEVKFRVIRTDAPVNSGNSGGGLYNDSGELIGIVNAKIADTSIENIGYALPSNVVRAVSDNIIDYCYLQECESVMRGLLGITIQISDYDTEYDAERGLLIRKEEISVLEVSIGGLGEVILQQNDVLKSITIGEKTVEITRQHHLIDAMLDVRVSDTVTIHIIRAGVEMTVSAVITEDCLVSY